MNYTHRNLQSQDYDVLIIGAGINGAVAAAALCAQGLKVLIVDKNDFASGSSSNSSNLVWGGIKYLESHEYLLVNTLCKSRNLLMRSYPSTVKEIRFLTSMQKGFRFPPFFVFLGSVLYWLIGRLFTRPPKLLSNKAIAKLSNLINTKTLAGGIEYSDAYLVDNDARFVFNFIKKAISFGADAENYMEVSTLKRENKLWQATLYDHLHKSTHSISATVVINAAGPWVDAINQHCAIKTKYQHVFSKGAHLIVDIEPKETRVLAFFANDGRLFFVMPMGNKTCIGTTDTQIDKPSFEISTDDIQFILDNANQLLSLSKPLTQSDVISCRCGVRPLVMKGAHTEINWQHISRKHEIDIQDENKYISIFGGKLTDCINVGNEVLNIVNDFSLIHSTQTKTWYGEAGQQLKETFKQRALKIGITKPAQQDDLWRRWGEHALEAIDLIQDDESMRDVLIPEINMIRAEIELTRKYEKVRCLEDFFRRRQMISLIVRQNTLLNRPETKEIAQILFGDKWDEELKRYQKRCHSQCI